MGGTPFHALANSRVLEEKSQRHWLCLSGMCLCLAPRCLMAGGDVLLWHCNVMLQGIVLLVQLHYLRSAHPQICAEHTVLCVAPFVELRGDAPHG